MQEKRHEELVVYFSKHLRKKLGVAPSPVWKKRGAAPVSKQSLARPMSKKAWSRAHVITKRGATPRVKTKLGAEPVSKKSLAPRPYATYERQGVGKNLFIYLKKYV
jgi:hypothetical protein